MNIIILFFHFFFALNICNYFPIKHDSVYKNTFSNSFDGIKILESYIFQSSRKGLDLVSVYMDLYPLYHIFLQPPFSLELFLRVLRNFQLAKQALT